MSTVVILPHFLSLNSWWHPKPEWISHPKFEQLILHQKNSIKSTISLAASSNRLRFLIFLLVAKTRGFWKEGRLYGRNGEIMTVTRFYRVFRVCY